MQVKSSAEILGAIKMYMYVNDITQDDLAHKLGKSKQTISSVFRKGNPTTENLFDICNSLNIRIICDIEEPAIPNKK